MRAVLLTSAIICLVLMPACSSDSSPAAPAPTPTPGSTQPSAAEVARAVSQHYQREFGEQVASPAIYSDAASCGRHVTSTMFLRSTNGRSRLRYIYTSADGLELIRKADVSSVMTPAGSLRVLVAVMTYPATFSEASLPLWEAAQAQINEDHAAHARARGYPSIVSFESTNVLIPGDDLRATPSRPGMLSALTARGIAWAGYDFVIVLNIDPAKSEGGQAFVGQGDPAFVYVGNYFSSATTRSSDYLSFARTVYHHEIPHHWGWPGTHDWSLACSNSSAPFAPFIIAPALFGWEDTDGDGVPEILDNTPYGRAQ